MEPFPKKAFIIVVALQILVLGGMIAKREYLLRSGKVVHLKCEPVDPRSLFSGDYVILNFDISNLADSLDLDNSDTSSSYEETVYVALDQKQGNKFWQAVAFSRDLAKIKAKYPVIIRGKKRYSRVRYGVEQYFVPQGEGLKIEKAILEAQVAVDVAISSSGESAVKKLYIAGQEIFFY